MITLGNRQSAGMGYTLAFLFASFSFLIGSLLVKRVRGST
jgi:hypothetical protein